MTYRWTEKKKVFCENNNREIERKGTKRNESKKTPDRNCGNKTEFWSESKHLMESDQVVRHFKEIN